MWRWQARTPNAHTGWTRPRGGSGAAGQRDPSSKQETCFWRKGEQSGSACPFSRFLNLKTPRRTYCYSEPRAPDTSSGEAKMTSAICDSYTRPPSTGGWHFPGIDHQQWWMTQLGTQSHCANHRPQCDSPTAAAWGCRSWAPTPQGSPVTHLTEPCCDWKDSLLHLNTWFAQIRAK